MALHSAGSPHACFLTEIPAMNLENLGWTMPTEYALFS